jgi:O-antigen ligase
MSVVRIGVCVLIAFAVLSFGAVEEWSQAAMEVGASLLLLYWAIRLYRRGTGQIAVSPLSWPLIVFAGVILAQIIFHTTASVYHTRVELQLVVAYLILLHLITQGFQRSSHWRNFVWFLMTTCFVVSIFGILQHLTFNGKLYWFRELRYGGYPFGPYVNRNHFAGFAELLIPLALVPLMLGKVRRERLFVVSLFALVPMMALFLSASRGGIISFGIELVVLFLLLLIRRTRSKFMLIGGAVVLCAVLAVSWIGVQQVLDRFSSYKFADVTSGKRAAMRHDSWRIFLEHPLLGTGLGTLQMVFPPYDSLYDGRVVNHAHNDYLEALAEAGILGGACCWWFVGVLLLDSWRGLGNLQSSFNSALNLSGLVGCSGILVHSLIDFNLHIPANAVLFFVAAHLATVRIQSDTPSVPKQVSRRRRTRKQSVGGMEQPV